MKRLAISFTIILLLAVSPLQLSAKSEISSTSEDPISNKTNILLTRLTEIKEKTKSSLTSVEKKALKKETRSIKRELKKLDGRGGIYISVGAVIIIILLLILIL
jgi:hypothetical protein